MENDVWRNFKKLDNHFARCNFCFVRISILRTPEENLTRHLEKKHPNQKYLLSNLTISLVDSDDVENEIPSNLLPNLSLTGDVSLDRSSVENESGNDADVIINNNHADLSSVVVRVMNGETVENIHIWKHYVKLGNGSALCGHCSKMISTTKLNYLTKLVMHLKEKHNGITEPVIMNEIENYKKLYPTSSGLASNSTQKSEYHHSVLSNISQIPKLLWKHFEVQKSHAKCLYCAASIFVNLKDAITRLTYHLFQKHEIVVDDLYCSDASNDLCKTPSIPALIQRVTSTVPSEPPPLKIIKVTSVSQDASFDGFSKTEPVAINYTEQLLQNRSVSLSTNVSQVSQWNGKITDEMILKMVVKGYHNFKIIENSGFKLFINNADSSYILPATELFRSDIFKKEYECMMLRTRQKLAEAAAITLSAEEFQLNDNRIFIEFKAHSIDSDCKMQSNTLNCFTVDPNESGALVSSMMNKTLHDYMTTEKLITTVSSNTPTMRKIIELNKRNYLPCFYNFMEIMVETSLNQINSILLTARQVVSYYHANPAIWNGLIGVQGMQESTQRLIQDEQGNWMTTIDMLNCLLEHKSVLTTISNSEWILIDHICKILHIFKRICHEMAQEKYSSLSKVIVYIDAIKQHINQYTLAQMTFLPVEISQIIDKIGKIVESYKITYLHLEATLLDPRFKNKIFKNTKYNQLAYESVCRIANSIVLTEDTEIIELPTDTDSIWYEWDTRYATEISFSRQNKQKGKDELDKYLKMLVIERNIDPLHWWASHKVLFPRLFQIVLNRMCIVASAVPSSRLVVPADMEIVKQRKQLTENNVSKIVFLHGNYD